MGKDGDAALMLQLLLMLLLMDETPGKNDLNGRTAEIINFQNSMCTLCVSIFLVCITLTIINKNKSVSLYHESGAQLQFL